MTLDQLLPAAVVAMTVFAIASAIILVRAAVRRPWIGALVERAIVGAIIAFFGAISALLVLNTETGHEWLDRDTAINLFRVSLLLLLFVPVVWDVLYFFGRLGETDEQGAAAILRARGWTVVEPVA